MAKFLSLPANQRQALIAKATEGAAGTLADLDRLLHEIHDEGLKRAIAAGIHQLLATIVAATYK